MKERRVEFVALKRRASAKKRCPWAEIIVKSDDGYWCFDSQMTYLMWKPANKEKNEYG